MSTMPSTNATPDFVPFRVSCVNACVQMKTTCMVLTLAQSISAGAYVRAVTFVLDQRSTGKNICVLPFVQLRVYAR